MLIKEKQGFSTLDFFTIVFSFGLIIYISAPIVSRHLESDGIIKAQKDIVEISRALLAPAPNHESFLASARGFGNTAKREIASIDANETSGMRPSGGDILSAIKRQKDEGDVGLDPWGNPYHYVFVRNLSGVQTHVIVWSDGPDRKSETEVTVQLAQKNSKGTIAFQGDDVGSVVPIR